MVDLRHLSIRVPFRVMSLYASVGQDEWDEWAARDSQLEKKRGAFHSQLGIVNDNSAPSSLSGILTDFPSQQVLVMSEIVVSSSVEAYLVTAPLQRRSSVAISCSVCFALNEAGYRQARRKTELRRASSSWGEGYVTLRNVTKVCGQNDEIDNHDEINRDRRRWTIVW